MFGFFIKKTFFDMWDNLFRIVFLNLGYFLIFGVAALLAKIIPYFTFLPQIPTLFFCFNVLLFVYTGAASCVAKDISDYREPGFRDFFNYLKETYKPSLLFSLVNFGVITLVTIAMPFYLTLKPPMGNIAFGFVLWLALIWSMSIQFFFPLQSRFDKNLIKNLKKIFLIFFDNTAFAAGVFLGSVFILVVSIIPALLFPGLASIVLWTNVGLKLRLYKYDYLEDNPGANRKKIPWDTLLRDDNERVGKRTLKGMIFPWKE